MATPERIPNFEEVVRLGEHLLGLPNTLAQIETISQYLQEKNRRAVFFLVRPASLSSTW